MKNTTLLVLIHVFACFQLYGQVHGTKCGLEHPSIELPTPEPIFPTAATAQWRSDSTYLIPVVVHILWHRDRPEENIPDWQVRSQIDILNETFGARNANLERLPTEFRNDVADIGFEFCLAQITRTETRFDSIGNIFSVRDNEGEKRLFRTELGGIDAWPVDQYLNIWVASTGSDFLGFGTLPDPAFRNRNQLRDYEDGIIVDPKHFGYTDFYPYHLGRIGTHEVGHYFNLRHIWGDRRGCDEGDEVEDTPNQLDSYSGCPSYPALSCSSSDMFMNYMDNTWDECQMLFTMGQRERMLNALETYRANLASADRCDPPPNTPAVPIFLYPNPADQYTRIVLQSDSPQLATLKVFDSSGKCITSFRQNSNDAAFLSTADWAAGIYWVSVVVGTEVHSKRLLVAHAN
ncbi:MAG: zinc-dependent metalloprotease [Bacteroidota bacterium]